MLGSSLSYYYHDYYTLLSHNFYVEKVRREFKKYTFLSLM